MTQADTFIATRLGEMFILRLLRPDDSEALGRYFASLSEETRRRFGPHPLDQQTADTICAHLDPRSALRWVTMTDQGDVVAYVIVDMHLEDYEIDRYRQYGIRLDPGVDCRLAPSVADDWQMRGVGMAMMPHILNVTGQIGRRLMILMGGTQATNERAIHFYQKLGFVHVGGFEYPEGVDNLDMLLDLTS